MIRPSDQNSALAVGLPVKEKLSNNYFGALYLRWRCSAFSISFCPVWQCLQGGFLQGLFLQGFFLQMTWRKDFIS